MSNKSKKLVKNWLKILLLGAVLAILEQSKQIYAQGIKGGNGFSSSSSSSSSSGGLIAPTTSSGGQSSSSFIQMFNSLTPIQQQQFIRQMSSSNKRVFSQAFPQQSNFNFNEEVSSSSGGQIAPVVSSAGATKSSSFKQTQNQILSPVQQGSSFFRSQQSKTVATQPTIQPSSFSFSRQVSSQQQQQAQPTFIPSSNSNSEQSFQVQRTVVQPQQASYFNRVQQVSQVAQPVVLPSSEQSFRRVSSFSSQPLPVQQTENSGFSQQFVQQQVQPAQTSSGFNRFQQFSSSQAAQPISAGFSQQFSSANNAGLSGFGSGSDFSSALQQEKLDSSSIGGGLEGFANGGSSSFESSSSSSGFNGAGLSGLSAGFESADAQQKNIQLPDDYNGLTAASINNKWYIMRPVENPSALGLGDASSASGSLRRLPLTSDEGRILLRSNINSQQIKPASGETGAQSAKESTLSSTPTAAAVTSSTGTAKKRSTAEEKKKNKKREKKQREESEAEEGEESSGSVSTSSALMESDDEDENERKR